MQIQPQFQTIGTLIAGRLFKIPEYQRAYSWQSKQRNDLFRDIEKVHLTEADSHFMATIVGLRRKKLRIGADEFIEIEVVDGQQRLTTLTILLKAISKRLTSEDAKYAKEVDALLVKGDALSLLLLQTNHDSSNIFVDYLRDGTVPSAEQVRTSADHNLLKAINECEQFVEKWTAKLDRKLIGLLGLLKNQLSVIFFEIEDEALVYTVFEVLNSRGLDVTWFDKLKSLLMATVFDHGDRGSKKETVSELHKLWTEIYTTIGLRWENLNRETVRFAGTLRVSKRPNRPLGEESAAQVLSDQCEEKPKKLVAITKWILSVTQAEARLLGDHRLRAATKIVQARLVAIAVLLRKLPKQEEANILSVWENVTFRIYGLGRRDARSKVGEYVQLAWRIANENLTSKEIIGELKTIGANYPIVDVVKKLQNKDCYRKWTEQVRYFFYRYEEHIAREAGHRLNETQWNKIWADEPSKSIEHIFPQSQGSEDPATSKVFVHRLGNLMMLPPGVNSKLQDDSPKDKAATYDTCGLLAAIEVGKQINAAKWDKAAIEKREKRLIKWALTAWRD
ncbi:MAG: DUF262 domain-containing HNH endonuclease family protein [Planctomycetota bacterium]|nr:DUF262 domain-containing HNH endonuclease family protein [Planctomycetota bacterium]